MDSQSAVFLVDKRKMFAMVECECDDGTQRWESGTVRAKWRVLGIVIY